MSDTADKEENSTAVAEPRKGRRSLGIVIPCYNEQEVIAPLIEQLKSFMEHLAMDVYVLFVDDGSTDETYRQLHEACDRDARFACLRLSRNFGHQTALTAGLAHIKGDAVAVLDADLQDPPSVVESFVEKWTEGYDVVYGIRSARKEGLFLRSAYALFYRLQRAVSNIDMPVDAGDFCLMDRRVVDVMNRMPEHNRFVRGLRKWVGFKQVGVPYERQARAAGASQYNFRKLYRLALDGFINFSSIPLRLASWLGAISAVVGFLLLLYVIISIFRTQTPIGWASTFAVIVFYGGIQLLVLGIIGEYLGRMFEETKNRPLYVIADQAGWV